MKYQYKYITLLYVLLIGNKKFSYQNGTSCRLVFATSNKCNFDHQIIKNYHSNISIDLNLWIIIKVFFFIFYQKYFNVLNGKQIKYCFFFFIFHLFSLQVFVYSTKFISSAPPSTERICSTYIVAIKYSKSGGFIYELTIHI